MNNKLRIKHNLTYDDTREISVSIVDNFVFEGLVKSCVDTNDETEFKFQDIIHDTLNKLFDIKE